ncbi:MAG TPA: hypothetical protein VK826_02890 [Bacteroidia bacterium]|nr:hypothetical protein [Bacteroidia bacterium]
MFKNLLFLAACTCAQVLHAQTILPSPQGPENKPFMVYFGYGVSPNKMTPVSQFYCASEPSGSFTVKKRSESGVWSFKDATPVIYYTWVPQMTYHFLPRKKWAKTFGGRTKNFFGTLVSNHVYKIGFAGGLGLNLIRPQFMAAPSLIIGKNLSFQAGVCVMQKETLRGEYYEGQVLTEHLDFENLHRKIYYPEWFFSVAFRFDRVVFVDQPEE